MEEQNIQKLHPAIEGLNILAKYYPNDEMAAVHDGIYYAPYEPDKLSQEDLERLTELRWREKEDSWFRYV